MNKKATRQITRARNEISFSWGLQGMPAASCNLRAESQYSYAFPLTIKHYARGR